MLESLRDAEPGWELVVVAPGAGRLIDSLAAANIRVRVLPFPSSLARAGESARREQRLGPLQRTAALAQSASYASRLSAALREERPAIVHAHGFKMHVLSALARPSRTRVIWHMHGYLSGRPWTSRALAAVVRRASAVIANSRSVADDVRRVLGGRLPIRTIYNAVDLERFNPRGHRLDLDAISGIAPAPDGTVRVGLVGTFGRWKGHHVFLDALSKLPAASGVRGYVIGAPIYETSGSQFTFDELRDLARARGVADRVGFTGFVQDVPAAMRALDVVVHASTEPEPFGMVVAEAMACGRALVASRAGGVVELFCEGVEAIGHTPGDGDDLARVLGALVADPVRRARLGAAARARAEECFDHRRLAASLVPLYRSLAA